ncbi:MAG: hypothetical protein QOI41_241 [Myxococcales bacterium]|nr:hypothetical protein [Myxococcales bacterium]
MRRRAPLAALGLTALVACAHHPAVPAPAPAPVAVATSTIAPSATADRLPLSTPEAEGMDSRPLLALADAVRDRDFPALSILVSRHGRLVYELYTSSLSGDEAHYVMSVTKTFVSALVGIAIGEHLLPPADASIADVLPATLFPSEDARAALRPITIDDVLGMSALDAPDPPRVHTPEAQARLVAFLRSPSRVRFALAQAPLVRPGSDFQYNDTSPMLATGMLHHATRQTAFDYARTRLFEPMGFRHYEWMHQDPASVDNGGYGLRVRPVDMQKLGLLYLRHGEWNGRQLIPREWVERSFTPWNRAHGSIEPNYGSYWWTLRFGSGWTAHAALGWKGQRIAVFPEQDLVVTMTALVEEGDETAAFAGLVNKFLIPSVAGDVPRTEDPAVRTALAARLAELRRGPSRILASTEPRMVPTVAPKGTHRAWAPLVSDESRAR